MIINGVQVGQDAGGGWNVYDNDQSFTHFDTEPEARWFALTGEVLPAAEAARRIQMAEYAAEIGEEPIDVQIVRTVIRDILPALRRLLTQLTGMQMIWQANDFDDLIATATANNELIVGFEPAVIDRFGKTFNAVQVFLMTPREDLGGKTPNDILQQVYTARATG
jgi:hypothetical protein